MAAPEIRLDLERGERLVWSGAPAQGILLRPADALVVAVTVLLGSFFVRWVVPALGAPDVLAMLAIPFALPGPCVAIGRLLVDAWRRRRTAYWITSQRIVVRTGSAESSLSFASLGTPTLHEHKDGSGTIAFHPPAVQIIRDQTVAPRESGRFRAFERIPDARRVHALVLEARKVSRATSERATPAVALPVPPGYAGDLTRVLPAPTHGRNWGHFACALMAASLGVAIAIGGARDWYLGVHSLRWPVTQGWLLESGGASSPGDERSWFGEQVSYVYRVDGRELVSRRVGYGRGISGSSWEEARAFVRRHPKARFVRVFYDPARPDRAVLHPGWTWFSVAQAALGLVILAGTIGLYRVLSHVPRQGQRTATRFEKSA